MSGVGNYVHWHANRYRQFGINKDSGDNNYKAARLTAYQMIDNAFTQNNSISTEQAKKLAEWYSQLTYAGLDKEIDKIITTNQNGEEVTATFVDILNEMLKQEAESANQKLPVTLTPDIMKKLLQERTAAIVKNLGKARDISRNKEYVTKNVLKQYVDSLKSAMDAFSKITPEQTINIESGLAMLNPLPGNEKLATLHDLEMAIRKLHTYLKDELEQNGAKRYYFQDTAFSNGISIKQVLQNAKQYLDLLKGTYGFGLSGKGFELVGVIQNMLDRGIVKEMITGTDMILSDFVKGLRDNVDKSGIWTGGQNNIVAHATADFDENLLGALKLGEGDLRNYHKVQNAFGTLEVVGAMDTEDLILTPAEGSELANAIGLKSLAASVKNYSTSDAHGIHIIDSTNLLNVMMLYLNSDFINHYLNIISVHPWLNMQSNLNDANQIIYYAILARSILGARKRNQVFIVNIRATRTITVIRPEDFRVAETQLANLNSFLAIHGDWPIVPKTESKDTDPGTEKNTYNSWVAVQKEVETKRKGRIMQSVPDESMATARIANLIFQVHDVKISASLLPSALSRGQSVTAQW